MRRKGGSEAAAGGTRSLAIGSCPPEQKRLEPAVAYRGRFRHPKTTLAPVAQLDRAPDYESGGREFESLRARQQFQYVTLATAVLDRSLERRLERRFQVRVRSERYSAGEFRTPPCSVWGSARCRQGREVTPPSHHLCCPGFVVERGNLREPGRINTVNAFLTVVQTTDSSNRLALLKRKIARILKRISLQPIKKTTKPLLMATMRFARASSAKKFS